MPTDINHNQLNSCYNSLVMHLPYDDPVMAFFWAKRFPNILRQLSCPVDDNYLDRFVVIKPPTLKFT